MKSPRLITAVTAIQLVVALVLASLAVFVLLQTRSPQILSEPDAADIIRGLKIGALALGLPALILAVAAYGLWKAQLWGWWLAFLINLVVDGILIYSIFEDGWRAAELDNVIFAVCFAIPPILLLLPKVLKLYWKGSQVQPLSVKT
jgi:hypothetical protein